MLFLAKGALGFASASELTGEKPAAAFHFGFAAAAVLDATVAHCLKARPVRIESYESMCSASRPRTAACAEATASKVMPRHGD